MKKTNYHTHTKRCMHAEGTEADYVKAALDAGLDVLGFSDHGPFPDNRFDSRMPYADPYADFWKKVAKTSIPVLIGSDCHDPAFMWDSYVEEAYRIAAEWNLSDNLTDTF